jgi:SAM-dependent methyltransferase
MRRRAETAFWDLQSRTWDERYADPVIAARVDELAGWLVEALEAPEPTVVDLGCGTGSHARAVAVRRGHTVVGLELSPGMASAASSKAVAVVRTDVGGGLPLASSSIDGALSVYSLQFLDAPAVLREVGRVLRPSAPLLVEVPRTDGGRRAGAGAPWSWRFRAAQRIKRTAAAVGGRVGLVRTFTAAELDRLLQDAGFDVVEHRDTERAVAALARPSAPAGGPGRPGGPPSGS